MDSGTSLDDMEKTKFVSLSGLELRPVSRPARIQSLSRLPMKVCRGVNVLIYLHTFLTSTLGGRGWSASRSGFFSQDRIGSWVGPSGGPETDLSP
jgi:hypothetical protein